MKINIYLLYFYTIFFIKIALFNSSLVLPIETLTIDNYIRGNYSSYQEIIRNLLYKNIYTIFEIGTPVQKVPLFIKVDGIEFEITSLSFKRDNFIPYYSTYNLSSIFNKYNFFNENKSLIYQTEGCSKNYLIIGDHQEDCLSYDTIFFYQDKNLENLIKFENFDFNLVKNKDENITGVLGIGQFDNLVYVEKIFLKILKEKNIINNYNWYFKFDSWNNSNGKIIIGSLPHEDYPDIFSEEDLLYIRIPEVFSTATKYIQIEFDEIYTNYKNSTYSIELLIQNAIFNFHSDITIGTKEFERKIKDKFLDNFIENKKCFEEKLKLYLDDITELKFYYCDINVKENLYKILPSIKFVSRDLKFIFELSKNELYKIEGNYIYFLILFDSGKQNNWILGRPITLKYPFVFNSESNKVALYRKIKTKKDSETEREKINYKRIFLVFIVIIISIILVILGIIIGKILYGISRKKRANELIDNYEYISDNIINKDINKNIKYNINDKKSLIMNILILLLK